MNVLKIFIPSLITEEVLPEMKNKRIVIPESLCNDALKVLHRSHMGIVKTKERASTSMFWPKIYSDIENYLSTCCLCMMYKVKQAEPLEHDIPTKPWCSLTLDNFEYKGNLYLIIYDRFTRFIVIKKCADLSAHSAILSLLEVFCEHGVPLNIHSDRGRNFVSKEFDTFCKDLGIVLNSSSGYHHSANQAEHAIRTVKDLMKRCDSAGVHWRIALLEFLCTPGPDGVSSSSLMGRQFHGILPMINKVANDIYSDKLELLLIHQIIEVTTSRLRMVILFPATGYISMKLMLSLFHRCRIFQKFQKF